MSYDNSVYGGQYDLHGRLDIYTSAEEITADNVILEVNKALSVHIRNLLAEEYLYWYRRGMQPILTRTKERNTFICNKVVENHAAEIVAFKNGYFLTQPCSYIARKDGVMSKVDKMNEFLFRSGKQTVDNVLADWFHTVGKAALYVEPSRDNDKETPIKCYALDPRSAFVVYSMRPTREPVMGINLVTADEKVTIDVYTKNLYFQLSGTTVGKIMSPEKNYTATAVKIEKIEPNVLGNVPIIEYKYNSVNMSAFESVVPILDEINNIQSNRCDGVEQFIQNLVVLYNCQLPDDENANSLKQKGLLMLKSVGENKASIDVISEELNQTQTQVLIENLYEQALRICSMPATNKGGRSTSDTGTAVLARDGWYQADCAARNTEDLFKESNRYFDRIFVDILDRAGILKIDINDFELNFVRNETQNAQSKAQTVQTLLAAGLAPELAFARSGISSDPVADVKLSDKYLKMIWGDPDKPQEEMVVMDGQNQAQPVDGKTGKQDNNQDNNQDNKQGGSNDTKGSN